MVGPEQAAVVEVVVVEIGVAVAGQAAAVEVLGCGWRSGSVLV